MRDKDKVLTFRVNQKELDRINAKREEIGIRNMGAYLRKMAMQDYLMAQKIVEVMLEKDDREQERQQLQREQNRKQR